VSLQVLRTIDANVNRSREGLRVLEDVARYILNDAESSRRLRSLRHDLARETVSLNVALLSHRDSVRDVGRPPDSGGSQQLSESMSLRSLQDVVTANARRAEEALRVIEELAKLPELRPILSAGRFEQARFAVYDVERELFSRISRRDKTDRLSGLYVIVDRQFAAGRDETDVTRMAIEGGASAIQLRDKQAAKGELLLVAQKLRKLCGQAGILFIVNDHLDLALAVDADGVHVGRHDLPLPVVRSALPIDKIVGCSVTTLSRAVEAQDEGADYIAVGSIFPTTTKSGTTVVGLDVLRQIKRRVSVPVVAIGGINRDNIGQVVEAGANSVAVVSAVLGEEDVREAGHQLVLQMKRASEERGTDSQTPSQA